MMKVLWAVDPWVEDRSVQRAAAWALHALEQVTPLEIEPVHVFGTFAFDVPLGDVLSSEERVNEVGRNALMEIIGDVEFRDLLPLKVLTGTDQGLKHEAQLLVSHARDASADLIVVSTQAKKGLDRFLLGSFAETLLHQSEVPLLLVNPTWDRIADFQEILFPTDFSDESNAALEPLMRLAQALKSRIVLFHKLERPVLPNFDIQASAYLSLHTYFQEELALKEEEMEKLAKNIRNEGVAVESVIDAKFDGDAAEGILEVAEGRSSSVIAVVAHRGAISRELLGSVAVKIMRSATRLVWVVYPPARQKHARPPRRDFEVRPDA